MKWDSSLRGCKKWAMFSSSLAIQEKDVCIVTDKDIHLMWDLSTPQIDETKLWLNLLLAVCWTQLVMGPRAPAALEDEGTQCNKYDVGKTNLTEQRHESLLDCSMCQTRVLPPACGPYLMNILWAKEKDEQIIIRQGRKNISRHSHHLPLPMRLELHFLVNRITAAAWTSPPTASVCLSCYLNAPSSQQNGSLASCAQLVLRLDIRDVR